MNQNPETPEWVYRRILAHFNWARNVEDILDGSIKDDPSDGNGRTMGRALAARILRARNAILPFKRFSDFDQLDKIPGVGEGTINDLIYSFGTSAAQAFKSRMYDENVIFEANWPLEYFRFVIDDKSTFEETVSNKASFRNFVCDQIAAISEQRELKEKDTEVMLQEISMGYLDDYHNSTPAPAYALALWFYEFDADNWFSWEKIQEVCQTYFDHHSGANPWDMELRFFKGFKNRGIIPQGISPDDLPVVVNWPEQAITIWVSELYD